MKKILGFILLIGLIATCAYSKDFPALRTNQQAQPPAESQSPQAPEMAEKVKEFFEIQKKMFEMEKGVIQQDKELQQMAEQIKQLQQQLREKIEEKLKENDEYQSLKNRREQIRQTYKNINIRSSNIRKK